MRKLSIMALFASALFLQACGSDEDSLDTQLIQALQDAAPNGGLDYFKLPASNNYAAIPQDPKNPITADKVALGQLLFHETGLAISPKYASAKGTYSCASCHHVEAGFQAGVPQGIGEGGIGFGVRGEARTKDSEYADLDLDVQPIRSPSAMNGAYQKVTLWNGQFGATGMNVGTEAAWTVGTPKERNNLGFEGLETQAIAGMVVHRLDVTPELVESLGYKEMFDKAFAGTPAAERYTKITAGLAIAAYERTMLSNKAPFQEWLKGNFSAMSDQEKKGAMLFFGKAGCVSCHTGPALNSMAFYGIGMPDLQGEGVYGGGMVDAGKGRGSFTGRPEDMYKFKVPQLYNLTDSKFYGHGATFHSVASVVEYKNKGVSGNPAVPRSQIDPSFKPLGLSTTELQDITAFLERSLYDSDLQRYVPAALKSGNCFPNADAKTKIDIGCN